MIRRRGAVYRMDSTTWNSGAQVILTSFIVGVFAELLLDRGRELFGEIVINLKNTRRKGKGMMRDRFGA